MPVFFDLCEADETRFAHLFRLQPQRRIGHRRIHRAPQAVVRLVEIEPLMKVQRYAFDAQFLGQLAGRRAGVRLARAHHATGRHIPMARV
ncbi:hypothetical protein D3C76_1376570 [compost metagenome]